MITKEEKAKKAAKRLAQIPFGFEGGQELQDILDKGSATPDEMNLLRDRRSYLTEEQMEHFGLNEPEPEKEPEAEEVEPPKPVEKPKKKKGKK
jgi:hypothetical protein